MNRFALLFVLVVLVASPVWATNYFVAEDGDDANPGTRERPFRTIQKAADSLRPGETCFVRAGTYRGAVEIRRGGRADAPIRFQAYPGEVVLLDGTEPIAGPWSVHEGRIYKTRVQRDHHRIVFPRSSSSREITQALPRKSPV